MNIPIELLGHKGKLTHIFSRTKLEPWYPEDELLVNVEFDNDVDGIISTAISIPVKDNYSRESFLKVVKERGEKQLAVTLEKRRQEQERWAAERQSKEYLDTLAHKLQAHLETGLHATCRL